MTAHYDCDCPECLMEQIPQPAPGFSPAALKELWEPDPYVERICQGCSERGDCVYAGDRSARVMCRVVKRELGS
jgi:hypothetical protein